MSPRKPITAAELDAQLEHDPQYQARMRQAEALRQKRIEQHRLAAAPVVQELNDVGFEIDSLDELRRSGKRYVMAVPVLLKWLPVITEPDVKESIVRTLSVPWAKPLAARPLITEFRIASGPPGLKWAIGNALEIVADDSVFPEIVELVRDKRHGTARQMLAVALGNMHDSRAADVALELLHDEDVVGHAVMALGKLKAQNARPQIESLLNRPKAWVRKEAMKALARLDK